ncbi:MAG: hypothetical protein F4045_05620 [Chloroflexi bacterium]|nr:hypothetical protein [Chloroflexota bacterium]MYK34583.1 hypothetical protein [Chloroflexota bacterium]
MNQLTAFVIMPFDEEFDLIYSGFIKPALEAASFSVERADDIESQQNILRDILEKIVRSDLIVADLTTANPNVFYELGLTHALRKPVILMTQSITDVPFDLKSYRLLEYSTHFGHIAEAKEMLTRYATGIADGSVSYGSPVTDFYQSTTPLNDNADSPEADTSDEDDRGLLDHQIALLDGYQRIGVLAEGITSDLQGLTRSLKTATRDFTNIGANPNESSPMAARKVARRLAERMSVFVSRLKQVNAQYSDIVQETENSLEFVIYFHVEQSDSSNSTPEGLDTLLTSLRSFESVLAGARDSQLEFATKLATLPQLERRLNRETAKASEEALTMAANLEKSIASISRVLKKYA